MPDHDAGGFSCPKLEVPSMCRLNGTVIQTVWWQVLMFTLYTTGIVCLDKYVDVIVIDFPLSLVSVLGVVTGLLLVFRTNTAYDRYWEGRKLWSTMTLNIRTLTRCIWVMVDDKEKDEQGNQKEADGDKVSQIVVEKISVINLLIAFGYATRSYLRENYSYEELELRDLISHIPRFSTPSSNMSYQTQEKERQKQIKREKKHRLELLRRSEEDPESALKRKMSMKPYEKPVPTNIPIELSYYIASYIKRVNERKLVDASTLSVMNAALNSLVDCLGGFERILRTPIPLAYSVHLQHATWLYLLALPYQLILPLGWFVIPAVALASFALLGILGIGCEIENPFGMDANDLPLDDFCDTTHQEILRIIANRMPNPETWILSQKNHPLAPECNLTASNLMKMQEPEIRKILDERCHVRHHNNMEKEKHKRSKNKSENGAELKIITVNVPGADDVSNGHKDEELCSMLHHQT